MLIQCHKLQRYIKKIINYLRQHFFKNTYGHELFPQKAPFLMFERVLITPMKPVTTKPRFLLICYTLFLTKHYQNINVKTYQHSETCKNRPVQGSLKSGRFEQIALLYNTFIKQPLIKVAVSRKFVHCYCFHMTCYSEHIITYSMFYFLYFN